MVWLESPSYQGTPIPPSPKRRAPLALLVTPPLGHCGPLYCPPWWLLKGSDVSLLTPHGGDCTGLCRAMSTSAGNAHKSSRVMGHRTTNLLPWDHSSRTVYCGAPEHCSELPGGPQNILKSKGNTAASIRLLLLHLPGNGLPALLWASPKLAKK